MPSASGAPSSPGSATAFAAGTPGPQARPGAGATRSAERDLRRRLVVAALAAFLLAVPLLALAVVVRDRSGPLRRLDVSTANAMHSLAVHHHWLRSLLSAGSVVLAPWTFRALVALAVIVLWVKGARRVALWAAVTMAVGGLAGDLLKTVVGRARPHFADPVATAGGFSFPSGHATNSFLGAGILVLAAVPLLRRRGRVVVWVAGILVVVLTGFDRVALGVHYASDVVGGWLLAAGVIAATAAAFETWREAWGRPDVNPVGEGIPYDEERPRTAGAGTRTADRTTDRTDDEGSVVRSRLRSDAPRVLVPAVCWLAVLVGVGFLLTYPLKHGIAGEDGLDRSLLHDRTRSWNDVTHLTSSLANTIETIAVTVVVALVLRWAYRRWLEPVTVVLSVLLTTVVFLVTSLVVHRPRPALARLDVAPPTSSFPSGHTGAATALAFSIALVLLAHVRRSWLRAVVVVLAVAWPVAVGLSRMYRGMHHPTDVLFGFLNGLVCVSIVAGVTIRDRRSTAKGARPHGG